VVDLNRKKIRSIEHDIATLFSTKSYHLPQTADDFKEIDFLGPKFERDNDSFYLKEKAQTALKRIVEIIKDHYKLDEIATYNDVYQVTKDEFETYILSDTKPSCGELISKINNSLSTKIFEYKHICRIKGIKLEEIDDICFGNFTITAYREMSDLQFSEDWIKDKALEEYNDSIIITAIHKGTESRTKSIFYHDAELVLSALLLYKATLTNGTIKEVFLKLCNDCFGGFERASSLSIPEKGSPTYTNYFMTRNELAFNKECYEYIKSQCFFDHLPKILFKDDRSDLEEAICNSIFWISESIKSDNNTTAFVKLWSAIESFFSTNKEEITENNATGIAVLLTYGGYQVCKTEEYEIIKTKAKNYYDLRSKAVHRGKYTDITNSERADLTSITSWIILSMLGLHSQGYKKLSEVKKQIDRLDSAKGI
jgi:hypothetical protein